MTTTGESTGQRARTVLLTLAAGQFLMTLDSSVMADRLVRAVLHPLHADPSAGTISA